MKMPRRPFLKTIIASFSALISPLGFGQSPSNRAKFPSASVRNKGDGVLRLNVYQPLRLFIATERPSTENQPASHDSALWMDVITGRVWCCIDGLWEIQPVKKALAYKKYAATVSGNIKPANAVTSVGGWIADLDDIPKSTS